MTMALIDSPSISPAPKITLWLLETIKVSLSLDPETLGMSFITNLAQSLDYLQHHEESHLRCVFGDPRVQGEMRVFCQKIQKGNSPPVTTDAIEQQLLKLEKTIETVNDETRIHQPESLDDITLADYEVLKQSQIRSSFGTITYLQLQITRDAMRQIVSGEREGWYHMCPTLKITEATQLEAINRGIRRPTEVLPEPSHPVIHRDVTPGAVGLDLDGVLAEARAFMRSLPSNFDFFDCFDEAMPRSSVYRHRLISPDGRSQWLVEEPTWIPLPAYEYLLRRERRTQFRIDPFLQNPDPSNLPDELKRREFTQLLERYLQYLREELEQTFSLAPSEVKNVISEIGQELMVPLFEKLFQLPPQDRPNLLKTLITDSVPDFLRARYSCQSPALR